MEFFISRKTVYSSILPESNFKSFSYLVMPSIYMHKKKIGVFLFIIDELEKRDIYLQHQQALVLPEGC